MPQRPSFPRLPPLADPVAPRASLRWSVGRAPVRNDPAARQRRRLLRVIAVVAVALAAGHLVQSLGRDGASAKAATVELALPAQPPIPGLVASVRVAGVLTGVSATAAPPVIRVAATPEPPPAPASPPAAASTDCTASLTLTTRPGAMLDLTLSAPCHAAERVVLRHGGLAITGLTDADGALALTLPALTLDGAVAVRFGDGETLQAARPVPDLTGLRRLALQWRAGDDLALRGPDGAALPPGTVQALGDALVSASLLAQVLTLPANGAEVVIQAAVTPATCGREVLGQTIVSTQGLTLVTDLTLAMPDCGGPTGYLLLKNPDPDMKIAAGNQ